MVARRTRAMAKKRVAAEVVAAASSSGEDEESDEAPEEVTFESARVAAEEARRLAGERARREKATLKEKRRQKEELFKEQKKRKLLPENVLEELASSTQTSKNQPSAMQEQAPRRAPRRRENGAALPALTRQPREAPLEQQSGSSSSADATRLLQRQPSLHAGCGAQIGKTGLGGGLFPLQRAAEAPFLTTPPPPWVTQGWRKRASESRPQPAVPPETVGRARYKGFPPPPPAAAACFDAAGDRRLSGALLLPPLLASGPTARAEGEAPGSNAPPRASLMGEKGLAGQNVEDDSESENGQKDTEEDSEEILTTRLQESYMAVQLKDQNLTNKQQQVAKAFVQKHLYGKGCHRTTANQYFSVDNKRTGVKKAAVQFVNKSWGEMEKQKAKKFTKYWVSSKISC